MRVHYILHAEAERLGAVRLWAERLGYSLSGTNAYLGESFPQLNEFDLLVLMGGPQQLSKGLNQFSYLQREVDFIKMSIAAEKKILGICLGAQLIAAALGAETVASPHREVGVFPVELSVLGQQDPLLGALPKKITSMHWHSEMALLPKDAVLLAHSAGCPHQAFRYRDYVYGLQFHLEFTRSLAELMIEHNAGDLMPGHYVQSVEQLLSADYSIINQHLYKLLSAFAELPQRCVERISKADVSHDQAMGLQAAV